MRCKFCKREIVGDNRDGWHTVEPYGKQRFWYTCDYQNTIMDGRPHYPYSESDIVKDILKQYERTST